MVDPNTRQTKRTPVTLKIKFKSETLAQFIERYAVDVSQGGIFIRTKEPLPAGTPMRFEFQLKDASPLIAGEGTVVWTRENDPTRPGVAPGMGVRFDRLADGSQEILDKILAEKAKQNPRQIAETKPPINAFQDVPTRVAPKPLVNALSDESQRPSRPSGSFDQGSDRTPLPKPMPFHSDADEFPDEAFEEATKVRPLDDLVAQSAVADQEEHPPEIAEALDELAARRRARLSGAPAPTGTPIPAGATPQLATKDAAEAPNRPSDPGQRPRLLDTSPSPRTQGRRPPSDRVPVATAEPLPAPPRTSSRLPTIIILFLIAAAAGAAAVWFLVLRKQEEEKPVTPGSGSALQAGTGTASTQPSGSAPSLGTGTGSDTGTAGGTAAAVGPGSGGSPAETVKMTIDSKPAKATVELIGTDQKGPAPFVILLPKGEKHEVQVSAPGFTTKKVPVIGGEPENGKIAVELDALQKIVQVTSSPPGALVFVDGGPTQKVTPSDIKLSATQMGRSRIKITLRKSGFAKFEKVVAKDDFQEKDGKLMATVDAGVLTPQRPSGGGGGGGGGGTKPPGGGTGGSSGTGASGGSGEKPPGGGSGSAEKPPGGGGGSSEKPPGGGGGGGSSEKPPASSGGGGGGSGGTDEPAPDWTK